MATSATTLQQHHHAHQDQTWPLASSSLLPGASDSPAACSSLPRANNYSRNYLIAPQTETTTTTTATTTNPTETKTDKAPVQTNVDASDKNHNLTTNQQSRTSFLSFKLPNKQRKQQATNNNSTHYKVYLQLQKFLPQTNHSSLTSQQYHQASSSSHAATNKQQPTTNQNSQDQVNLFNNNDNNKYLGVSFASCWQLEAFVINCTMVSLFLSILATCSVILVIQNSASISSTNGAITSSKLKLGAAETSGKLFPPDDEFKHPQIKKLQAEFYGNSLAAAGPMSPNGFDHFHDASAITSLIESEQTGDTYSATSNNNIEPNKQQKADFKRLPLSVWPQHYDISIQAFLEPPFNFLGNVSIILNVTENSQNITLHSNLLTIDDKSVKVLPLDTKSPPLEVQNSTYDQQLQHFIVHLKPTNYLQANSQYKLIMKFNGTLSDDLTGFYKLKYKMLNSSQDTWIAATQFEATDARRAFPCFDEPLYKATFGLSIKHSANLSALSNMPIIQTEISDDKLWVTDTFDKSAKMSTYLVAFTITNFDSLSDGKISVWARPGLVDTAKYSLDIGKRILKFYEDFFGVEYPLPKLDMIALPDFNSGAMENWGLVTYRETAMLYDANTSSITSKMRVAEVVAHELAHQWFGNLVTPKWWDDLWLNEGFASYVEYLGVDHVEPNWKIMDMFVTDETHDVLEADSLSSSHQISIPVHNPDEISEIFDRISYGKGAVVIRMMREFLTKEVFIDGIRKYLAALKYSNAEQSDLWLHLTQAQLSKNNTNLQSSNKFFEEPAAVDVGKVMNSWTLQTGYPLVSLTRKYNSQHQAPEAFISQERFVNLKQNLQSLLPTRTNINMSSLLPTSLLFEQLVKHKYEVPVTLTHKSELMSLKNNNDKQQKPHLTETKIWLHQNDTQALQVGSQLLPKSNDDWVLLNVDQVGLYRVNYDKRNWQLLVDQLMTDHTVIGHINRGQIMDDLFALAKNSMIDYVFVLNATRYLKNEHEYIPFYAALKSLAYISDMLERTAIYGDFKKYMSEFLSPYYNRYTNFSWLEDESQVRDKQNNNQTQSLPDAYNLIHAILSMCRVNKACRAKAREAFDDFKKTGVNRINSLIRANVYGVAIADGDESDWNFLWSRYEKEQNSLERDRLQRALSNSKEHWILKRYIDWTFDKTKPIRRQDASTIFRQIARNPYGHEVAKRFLKENWPMIREHYGKSSGGLSNLVRSIGGPMNTRAELQEFVEIYSSVKSDLGVSKRAFMHTLEDIASNTAWMETNYKTIEKWLENYKLSKTRS